MATTSPDGIYYPLSSDLVAPLETVLANNAATIQAALTSKVGPYSSTGATPGLIPAGTTAQRDAYWTVPGTAAARVALANKGARWFNTDKGYQERYYSANADASANLKLSLPTSGWKPEGIGLVPVTPTSVTGAGTAITNTGTVTFTAATAFVVNGIFSTDFENYRLMWSIPTRVGTAVEIQRLASGGTANSGAIYSWRRLTASTAISQVAVANDTSWNSFAADAYVQVSKYLDIYGPGLPQRTLVLGNGQETDGASITGITYVGQHNSAVAYDGIQFSVPSGSMTGTLHIYGYNN